MTMADELAELLPKNVKFGCICINQGKPDVNGLRIIDPCCRIHYAERTILQGIPESEMKITQAEIADWQRRERKRVSYPKMTVAKH